MMESSDCCVYLDASAFGSWRSIALDEDLASNRDVVHFLIDLYKAASQERKRRGMACQRCQNPLSLYCVTCQLPADPVSVSSSFGKANTSQHSPVAQQNLSFACAVPIFQASSPAKQNCMCGQNVSTLHTLPFPQTSPSAQKNSVCEQSILSFARASAPAQQHSVCEQSVSSLHTLSFSGVSSPVQQKCMSGQSVSSPHAFSKPCVSSSLHPTTICGHRVSSPYALPIPGASPPVSGHSVYSSHTLAFPRISSPQQKSVSRHSISSLHTLPSPQDSSLPQTLFGPSSNQVLSVQQSSGHQAPSSFQQEVLAHQAVTTQSSPSVSMQPSFTLQVLCAHQVSSAQSTSVSTLPIMSTQQDMSTQQVMSTQPLMSTQQIMSTQEVISTQQVPITCHFMSTQVLPVKQSSFFEHTSVPQSALHSGLQTHCLTPVVSQQSQLPFLTAIGAGCALRENGALEKLESDAESEQKQIASADSDINGITRPASSIWHRKQSHVKGMERKASPIQSEKKNGDENVGTSPSCTLNLQNGRCRITLKGNESPSDSKNADESMERNVDEERSLCQDKQCQRHRNTNASVYTNESSTSPAVSAGYISEKRLLSKPCRSAKLKSCWSLSGDVKKMGFEVQDPAANDCAESGDQNRCDGNENTSDSGALLRKDVLTRHIANGNRENPTAGQNYVCEQRGRGRPRSKLISGKYLGVLRKPSGRTQCYSLFECSHCQAVFDKKKDFNQHMSSHYPQFPHVCRKCGESFHIERQLNDHKRRFHPSLDKPARFACDQCSAVFKTEGRFQHHRKLHEENKMFTCKTCSFVAQSQKSLNTHRLMHRGPAVKQCEYCGQTKRISNLQRHLRMHRGEKPHTCSQCNLAFRTAFDLKDHLKRRHSEVKPFSCEICGKRFMCGDNLKHHLLVHRGQRPFQCALCPSSFSRKDYLTKHVRTHTGEKPYRCPDCSGAFASSSSVKQHQKHCGSVAQHLLCSAV